MTNITPLEHDEQKALFAWAKWAEKSQYPELKRLHAIANGGYRNIVTARKMKAEGVKPGVPDISLPVPRHGYHGLYIELKRRKGGRLSPEQAEWIKGLREDGYRVDVCMGFEAARDAIMEYLS
jgi:hypothetical protein